MAPRESLISLAFPRVLKLVRVQIGALRIGDLQIGKWRHLTREEVDALKGSTARPQA